MATCPSLTFSVYVFIYVYIQTDALIYVYLYLLFFLVKRTSIFIEGSTNTHHSVCSYSPLSHSTTVATQPEKMNISAHILVLEMDKIKAPVSDHHCLRLRWVIYKNHIGHATLLIFSYDNWNDCSQFHMSAWFLSIQKRGKTTLQISI